LVGNEGSGIIWSPYLNEFNFGILGIKYKNIGNSSWTIYVLHSGIKWSKSKSDVLCGKDIGVWSTKVDNKDEGYMVLTNSEGGS